MPPEATRRCEAWIAGDKRVEPVELDPEDDALLLRIVAAPRSGPIAAPRRRNRCAYRHVAIDEVQDFSPLEVQVLMDCLDERRSLTLVGRHAAARDAGSGLHERGATSSGTLGIEGTAVETLQVSYRSSEEIARFAVELLGDLREDDAPLLTTRHGPPVELFLHTDHGAAIASLADALDQLAQVEPLASVAILTPNSALSELYYEGLERCEVPRLHRVTNQDFRFAPGIEITEIEEVKGLEFDYVILIDASTEHFPDDTRARRLLHVAATRAIHQLWITCCGDPSPVVEDAIRKSSRV